MLNKYLLNFFQRRVKLARSLVRSPGRVCSVAFTDVTITQIKTWEHPVSPRLPMPGRETMLPTSIPGNEFCQLLISLMEFTVESPLGPLSCLVSLLSLVLSGSHVLYVELPHLRPPCHWSIVAVIQSLSCVPFFATPGLQHSRLPCPSPSPSLLKFMSIGSVMLNHFILCRPLLLFPSTFPSIRVFPMSQSFASGRQSIGASAPVFPMNIQG